MKKATKILIVGFGSIGKRHARNLLNLGYKNILAADVNKKTFDTFEKKGGIRFYQDYKKTISSEKPNIIFVCTPPSTHIEIATYACMTDCDVFIEKPFFNKTAGVDALISKVALKKKIVMIGSNWQFREAYVELERLIKSKKYGRVIGGNATVSYFLPTARIGDDYKKTYAAKLDEGGVVLDTGSHILPYLIRLFGDLEKVNIIKSRLHLIGIDAEEAALITCTFKSGAIISVWMDYVSKNARHMLDLVFESGILNVDLRRNKIFLINNKSKKEILSANSDLNKMFVDELKYFLDCASLRKKPFYGLSEAKKDLRFLLLTH